MATTNFAKLTEEQKTVWSMDLWKAARNESFISKFLGKGPNSLIQHITELKKSEKGARAVITLLADLAGDGTAGDRTLEGNEEAVKTFDQVIRIDQLRHANRNQGRLADQKSVVDFRKNSRDVLAYWLADRLDQLAFMTLAGVDYSKVNSEISTSRIGSDFVNLEFGADVSAPATNLKRAFAWHKTGLGDDGSTSVVNDDKMSWNTILELKKVAKDTYMRGVKSGSEELFHAFLHPNAMLSLKKDADYRDNLRYAQTRGDSNELFTGTSVKIDGVMLHEFRHVPRGTGVINTAGPTAAAGSYVLFCGAQALGMADLGNPEWTERDFDYGNQQGISTAKILGFLKPRFVNRAISAVTPVEHGVIRCSVAD